MIYKEFNFQSIVSVDFGVALRSRGDMYFIPTDDKTKETLSEILRKTRDIFCGLSTDWELYDISEDYGTRRRVYAPRNSELMTALSDVYDAGALNDLTNICEYVDKVKFYFSVFRDNQNRRAVGIRRAAQLKGMLRARNRLVRIFEDTLMLIQDDVLRLDGEFDVIVTNTDAFILKPRQVEKVAEIVERVAATAAKKIQVIQDAIPFLDLTRIAAKIAKHPRMARLAVSVASNPNLAKLQCRQIRLLAEQHGIKFKELEGGRLQCRVDDELKLLQILDARRYNIDLYGDGGVPYLATARQQVSS